MMLLISYFISVKNIVEVSRKKCIKTIHIWLWSNITIYLPSDIRFLTNYLWLTTDTCISCFFGIWRSNFEIDHSLTAENRLSSYRSIAILQLCGYSNPIMIKKSIHSTIKNHSYVIESAVHENVRPYQVF